MFHANLNVYGSDTNLEADGPGVTNPMTQAALDMQVALEQQLSTEVASNLRQPAINHRPEDEFMSTIIDSQGPALNRDEVVEVAETESNKNPNMLRPLKETEANENPNMQRPILDTEVNENPNLHRPIETLRSDEVENRVEDAVMEPMSDAQIESFGRPGPTPEKGGSNEDDN